MRIMYLLFSFTVGGTERLVTNICDQMITENQDVHLFIVNDLIDESLISSLNKGVHVKMLKREVGSKDKVSPIIEVAKYVRKYKIEVVHCNSFNSPELLILSKIINRNCKIVSTIHGVGQFEDLPKFKIYLKRWLCEKFIGISDSVKDDIISAGIPENKVVRVYNGIDISKYDCAKYKHFSKEHIIIGCIARIMPKIKGQDVLLKATNLLKEKYPNVLVLFAGGVAKEQQKEYEEMQLYIEENKLKDNAVFVGNVDDVPEFLNGIDICVVPSRSEGFGLALIEAMSMGVPCVASNIAGPKEIVNKEGVGSLFESGNFKDLVFIIDEIISDFDSIKQGVWQKKDRIKINYSIQNMCSELLKIYNNF